MEIGELVNVDVGLGQISDLDCPFEHELPPQTEKVSNELAGDGQTLGRNMARGTGIHSSLPGDAEPDPRDRDLRSVLVSVNNRTIELQGTPLPYPVTCAAHHLIPAQESLKGHVVLNWMCEKGGTQTFKNGKHTIHAAVQGSKVWGNVGYNVNGSQNGVWLPGNYAVGGGKAGLKLWRSKQGSASASDEVVKNWLAALDSADEAWEMTDDPDEMEEPKLADALASATADMFQLAGTNFNVSDKNPKWGYVKASMTATKGQFHDRHPDYSNEVKKYLAKVSTAYMIMYKVSKKRCKECSNDQRPAGVSDSTLVGPPVTLVGRLQAASRFFRRHLAPPSAKLTAKNIYTSKWVRAWMDSPLR